MLRLSQSDAFPSGRAGNQTENCKKMAFSRKDRQMHNLISKQILLLDFGPRCWSRDERRARGAKGFPQKQGKSNISVFRLSDALLLIQSGTPFRKMNFDEEFFSLFFRRSHPLTPADSTFHLLSLQIGFALQRFPYFCSSPTNGKELAYRRDKKLLPI